MTISHEAETKTKELKITSVGEDVEKLQFSHRVGRNVNLYSYHGKYFCVIPHKVKTVR